MPNVSPKELDDILQKLCKWRALLAGWQLGTRPDNDPECKAVRDQREMLLLLRAEVSALVILLVDSKVFSRQDWANQLATEAKELDGAMERKFPGASTSLAGLHIDIKRALPWMKDFKS